MPYILLLSAGGDDGGLTRYFIQHETRDELVKMIIDDYEDYLIQQQLGQPDGDSQDEDLSYSSDDLNNWIDSFSEMVCLERQSGDLWIPYATSWIKEALYLYLREQSDRTRQESMEVDMNNVNPQSYGDIMV